MIKDLLVSFKDNLRVKTTNPFFGTLIIVWIIHNYKFVYSIFNFEKTKSLESRLDYLAKFLENEMFLPNMWLCIKISFVVLLCSYVLLNLSRLIVLFFEKIVSPNIFKLMDRGSVVLIDDYNDKKIESERFQKRFEQEQEAKLKLQNEYEILEKRLQTALKDNFSIETTPEIKITQEDIDKSDYDRIKSFLDNNDLMNMFKPVLQKILSVKIIADNDNVMTLMSMDLIKIGDSGVGPNTHYYSLTGDGEKLRQLMIDKEIKEGTPKTYTQEIKSNN